MVMSLIYSPTNSKTRRLAEYFPGEDLTAPMAMAGFSLPSGWSCPHAKFCLSKADRITGKITDSPQVEFRCWAASLEARLPNIRANYWNNYDQLRACKTGTEMVDLLLEPLPLATRIVRVHVHGDFYSQLYFNSWLEVCRQRPGTHFYAYTKSLPYWVKRLEDIPDNLELNASVGGSRDSLIKEYELKSATVVLHPDIADGLGLPIDTDEWYAALGHEDFALLINGTQPAGSAAGQALRFNRIHHIHSGYGKEKGTRNDG
jgi:hypothetical protein